MGDNKIRTGCVGWSYQDWIGPFYPPGSQPKDFLPYYSHIFDVVEVDTTFYTNPGSWLINRWKNVTPDDFQFTAKIPEEITHEKKLRDYKVELSTFLSLVQGLAPKLSCVLAQLPPYFSYGDDFEALRSFVSDEKIHGDLRLAVELRNDSFFRDETFDLLWENNVCLVWSINQYTKDFPAKVTSNFLYVRFIGDRRLKKFDRIQLNRRSQIEECWQRINSVLDSVDQVLVFANNHFEGFAPGTISEFKQLAGSSP